MSAPLHCQKVDSNLHIKVKTNRLVLSHQRHQAKTFPAQPKVWDGKKLENGDLLIRTGTLLVTQGWGDKITCEVGRICGSQCEQMMKGQEQDANNASEGIMTFTNGRGGVDHSSPKEYLSNTCDLGAESTLSIGPTGDSINLGRM